MRSAPPCPHSVYPYGGSSHAVDPRIVLAERSPPENSYIY